MAVTVAEWLSRPWQRVTSSGVASGGIKYK